MHKRQHVKCLSEFFDLTVISDDSDYDQICDKYRPNLVLIEGGAKDYQTHYRPKIANTSAHPRIPKVGLYREDSFCHSRTGFLSDMEHLGIDTYFAIAATTPEHLQEVAGRLFVWPNCVDTEIYRDYGEWKSIPVLFTGAKFELYPWRQQILRRLSDNYPCLICPHPGYKPRAVVAHVMIGERYARTINAASIVPACGTVVKEVVRKHFEIPACKACLVTEESPTLIAAGFADMVNCVFANEGNVLDKVAYLFNNPNELDRITKNGYELVRSRHTLKQRSQLLDWWQCHRKLRPGQKITQHSPFGPVVIAADDGRGTHPFASGAMHLALLHEGDRQLLRGKYNEAERLYLQCLSYLPLMPEAKLSLALCNLHTGKPKQALRWIEEPLQFTLIQFKAVDPDPVEWACYILSFLCLGRLDDARRYSAEFAWLLHPELNRVRWATRVLATRGCAPLTDSTRARYTIHKLPERSLKEWTTGICEMLTACGQCGLAATLARYGVPSPEETGTDEPQENAPPTRNVERRGVQRIKMNARAGFTVRRVYSDLKGAMKTRAAHILHSLELKYGYFLPYQHSKRQDDEFFKTLRVLARKENIKTALLIGMMPRDVSMVAFLAGIQENKNCPAVYCINTHKPRVSMLQSTGNGSPRFKWYSVPRLSAENDEGNLVEAVKQVLLDHHIDKFDLVFIGSGDVLDDLSDPILKGHLYAARVVILQGLSHTCNYEHRKALLNNPAFVLTDYDPAKHKGYALFQNQQADRA
jgi:tetratricopeptide (TPR) repeat protein